MKYILSITALAALASMASANLVLNGGFENNSAASDIYNMSNPTWTGTVANSTAYGSANELDLHSGATYGPLACEGQWKASLHSRGAVADVDAFTLDLSGPLTIGQTYSLSFCASTNNDFNASLGILNVGISNSATGFGAGVYSTGAIPTAVWTTYSTSFVAGSAANYLSVESTAFNDGWIQVDDFQLNAVPEPGTMVALGLGIVALLRRRR